jgi:DNA-binding CsgD family transcriptional regulator
MGDLLGLISKQQMAELDDLPVLEILYDAVEQPALWGNFLEALSKGFGAQASVLIDHQPDSRKYQMAVQTGLPDEFQRLYAAHYGGVDPWYLAGGDKLVRGAIEIGTSICPPSLMRKTEYYNDFSRRFDFFYVLFAILENQNGNRTVLSFLRERQLQDFNEDDVRRLSGFVPHLQRALRINRRIIDLKEMTTAAAAGLDALDLGIVGVQQDCTVRFANQRAEAFLRDGKVLGMRLGKLVCYDRRASYLTRLIKSVCCPSMDAGAGGAITLYDGDHPLHVSVIPSSGIANAAEPSQSPIALLVVTDPMGSPKRRDEILNQLFHLTPAEVRVCTLLLRGLDPAEIAEQSHCTASTVRFQLKCIYKKTGVGRQSQLVRLLSRIPGDPKS